MLLIAFLVQGCNDNSRVQQSTAQQIDSVVNETDSRKQIEELLRAFYKWHFTDTSSNELSPISRGDSIYVRINLAQHSLRAAELRATGFFSGSFIANYDNIVRAIDNKLKAGEMEWEVGTLPPFGNDADPWTNCQDFPDDQPWNKIDFTFVKLDKNNSIVTWTWKNPKWSKGFNYTIKLVKQNDKWMIDYLEGFDFTQFVK